MSSNTTLEQPDVTGVDEPFKAADLDFYALLRRQNNEGRLFFNHRRAAIFDLDAINTLRQQLVALLGQQMSKSIMLRFGYTQGYKDAEFLSEQIEWASDDDWLKAGFVLLTLKGMACVDTQTINFNRETNQFYMQGQWRNSFEAEHHFDTYGASNLPTCWLLAGYASGYATRFFGQELLAVETECIGQGHAQCSFEIKTLDEWGLAAEPYLTALHKVELSDQFEINQQLQEQARQLTLLNVMAMELNLSKTLRHVLNIAMSKTGQIINADLVSVALFNPVKDEFDEYVLYEEEISLGAQWPLEGTAMGKAIQENRAIITAHFSHSPFLEHNRLAQQGLWSGIVMPLVAGGRVVGALNVSSRTINAYGPKDEKLLLQITSLLAAAIENRRLFEQTQKRARREQLLREITSQVRGSVDVDTILQTAAKEVGLALGRPTFVYLNHQSNNASNTPGKTKEE